MLTLKFINRAKEIHNNLYEYEIYEDTVIVKDKIIAICNKHGRFLTRIHDHIYHGSGCPTCSREAQSGANVFVDRAKEQHGDTYDYSKVVYVNSYTQIKIICQNHGIFEQIPQVHLKSVVGCPKCDISNRTKIASKFIIEANLRHDNLYKYHKIKYINSKKKIEIVCDKHGSFWQTPENHMRNGSGCPICANFNRSKTYNAGREIRLANKNESGIIYLAEFSQENEKFVKIGITTGAGVITRFGTTHRGYKINNLFEEKLPMATAASIENAILEMFVMDKHTPNIKFGGYTECFTINTKDKILKYINRRLK